MEQFNKASFEEYFRYHNFSAWLDKEVGLENGIVTIKEKRGGSDVSKDMVSDVEIFENKKVRYKIKGGTAGMVYQIIFKVVDKNGQKWQDTIECKITQ